MEYPNYFQQCLCSLYYMDISYVNKLTFNGRMNIQITIIGVCTVCTTWIFHIAPCYVKIPIFKLLSQQRKIISAAKETMIRFFS